jgi:hypothetical protein
MATAAAATGRWTELRTGDLVLFGDGRPILSWLGLTSGPRWRHVGLVLREPEDAEPLLWEAVPHRSTVRQVALGGRIGHALGRVSARRLNRELGPVQRGRLQALRREMAAQERERDLLDLMAAGEDGWLGASTRHLGAPTAGELVARVFARLGLLESEVRGGRPARDFTPRHFGEHAGLQLQQGYALGPELALDASDEAAPSAPLAPLPA